MGFGFSPKIVTDGLVLYYDAANPNSYVSGSLIWNDLTGNGNHGTIVGALGYSAEYNGGITFNDDVANYVTCSQTLVLDEISIECVGVTIPQNTTSVFDYFYLFSTENNTRSSSISFSKSNNSTTGLSDGRSILAHEFYCFAGAVDAGVIKTNYRYSGSAPVHSVVSAKSGSNQVDIYINGNLVDSSWVSGSFRFKSGSLILGKYAPANIHPLTGSISYIRVYNRKLNSSEIQQNYNALKGRFGLT